MSGLTGQQQRLTFRDKAGGVCWQKQLRDKYLNEGIPPVPHLDVGKAIVRRVSWRFAQQIILKYEWLGRMSTTTTWCYGIFFGNHCAGVCCVDAVAGGNAYAHKEFSLYQGELVYLARGANVHWSPKGANSRLVSWTCRLLAIDNQKAKLMIAYSDTDAGEIGTIYQACNWVYVGRGSSIRQWIAPDGTIRDQKHPYELAKKKGGTRAQWVKALRAAGWTEQPSNPKHRYVYILDKKDKALVDRVERMRQPYPKREDMRMTNGSTSPPREGWQFNSDPSASTTLTPIRVSG